MIQIKREFFHKGVNNQKRPNIVVDIKRADISDVSKWTKEEREKALKFLEDSKRDAIFALDEAIKAVKLFEEKGTELDCPYNFTSRCTMGRCDCKPKQNETI